MQLNDQQKTAINTINGPLLVIAGAGSGKTRVVTCRIVNLIESGIPPSAILGLTFTNKAAEEMRERIKKMTNAYVLISTFHSLGARILRESIHFLSYRNDFVIYDTADTEKVIRDCLKELKIDDEKVDVKGCRNLISQAKNNRLSPKQVDTSFSITNKIANFAEVYQLYQDKLHAFNALDFDDLLFLTVTLLEEHPNVLAHYREKWKYLLIDEYQDTNEAQYAIVKMLTGDNHNLCVVGDPDQSIYSWRGANISNILNFEKDFPGTTVVQLTQNYRSTSNILEAANSVIMNNTRLYEKELWSNLNEGEKILFYSCNRETDEAKFIADRIRYHLEQGVSLKDIVVFYRTNNQSRVFEDYFVSKRIPYVIVGGISFYQRKEIKDLLAFLRLAHSASDYVSFVRTINIPKRGIGEATIEKIRLNASSQGLNIIDYIRSILSNSDNMNLRLTAKQKTGLQDYISIIDQLRSIATSQSIVEVVKAAISLPRYLEYLELDPENAEDRKGNVNALITKALEWQSSAEHPSLSSFLEELSLKASLDEASTGSQERMSLMTLHNSKGLEFRIVFLAGMEEGLFPYGNVNDDDSELQEERRLCYVGMTRAKEILYISYCSMRHMWGAIREQKLSRFIKEIPSQYICKLSFKSQERPETSMNSYLFQTSTNKKSKPTASNKHLSLPNNQQVLYSIGETIFHKEYGVGVIREVYESSVGMTYRIFFPKEKTEKSIVAKYADLKKL